MAALLEAVILQGVWLACVLGAANGRPWTGVLATATAVAVFLYRSSSRPRALQLLAVAAFTGAIADASVEAAGAFSFPEFARLGWPIPLWMIALWINFATALHGPLQFLSRYLWAAAAAGAAGGPASYYAGARLGAIQLSEDAGWALALIAAEWAIAMPWLAWFSRRS